MITSTHSYIDNEKYRIYVYDEETVKVLEIPQKDVYLKITENYDRLKKLQIPDKIQEYIVNEIYSIRLERRFIK